METPRLILASASPRRFDLLRGLGLQFDVMPTHCPEPPPTREEMKDPGSYVEKIARLKAEACPHEGLVLAADTVVVLQDDILGKPRDEEEAFFMLSRLQGHTHKVFTGLCLRQGETLRQAHQITSVTFGSFDETFLRRYVQTGEPMDKAGAYAAQGKGAVLLSKLDGCYWNVVGLPLSLLHGLLRDFGIEVDKEWVRPA